MKIFPKILVFFSFLALLSCEEQLPEKVPVTAVSLNTKSVEMTEGDEITLIATVSPENADNKKVIWTTNNISIASVSYHGVVTANKPGKTMITVVTDDGAKTATCEVTVNSKFTPVTSVSLDKTSLELTEGDYFTLKAIVLPDHATNKKISWDSSSPSVASVSENGLVTAIKPGMTTITVKTDDGNKTATCEVNVKEKIYSVTSVSLDKTSLELTEGEQFALNVTVSPDNAADKTVTWSSSNHSVASVSDNGVVTAIKSGIATVTVRTNDGDKTADCEVTVLEPQKASSLSISETYIDAYIYRDHSQWYDLTVSAYPSDAVTDYEWTSSDTQVAKVNWEGSAAQVYTEDYGEAIITVTDKRTGLSASATIHTIVDNFKWEEPQNETLDGYPLITVYLNETHNLQCSYSPFYATGIFNHLNQFTFYENGYAVGSPRYISISEDGVIKGLEIGITGIEPSGVNIKSSGSERLYVSVEKRYVPVTSISLDKTYLSMTQYDTETLRVTVSPNDATDPSVIWSSSNPSVATVDTNGKVTAVSGGSATITVMSHDSSLTASCAVSVTADSHEAVDLGLSVKWAASNYNAASPSEVGGYYLWGDPTGTAKLGFDIIGGETLPMYDAPNMDMICGTSYDIARSKWGGKWRLPTMDEFWELYTMCTWRHTTMNGIDGIEVTGPNGNSIFLPMTGYAYPDDGPIGSYGITDSSSGYYMTGESYKDSYGRFAYSCKISSNATCNLPSWRVGFAGMPVRPVRM